MDEDRRMIAKQRLDNLPFAKKEDVETLETKMDAINAKLDQLLSK